MAFTGSFDYLGERPDLTPDTTNYIDTYNFATYDIPHLKEEAIKKFDHTIYGFVDKFSSKEQMRGYKYLWTELDRRAVTYDDLVLTNATQALTRASSAEIKFRAFEKVKIYSGSTEITVIVKTVSSATSLVVEPYDAAAVTFFAGSDNLSAAYGFSLGIEVPMGFDGSNVVGGVKQPYTIRSNRPAITYNKYEELGSVVPVVKWVKINGQNKWFIGEADNARADTFEMIEKKHIMGEAPSASATWAATTQGLQGTSGAFDQVRTYGASWQDPISSVTDLENIIKHLDKVNGSGVNLFLTNRATEFAFDQLGRTFNATYGGSATQSNYVGEYYNEKDKKILKLGFRGFSHGGYVMLKQGWKFLKENTFLGNSAIGDDSVINFLMIPVGMTPVSEGDQSLEFNTSPIMKNYMTVMESRAWQSWVTGGAGWMDRYTDETDKFKIHFRNESMLALFNAEKFILGETNS